MDSQNYLEQAEELERKEKEMFEREKRSPFKNFVQVNKDYYEAEDWLLEKSPIAYRIFKFLVNNMDGYNAVVCSQTVIQDEFQISRPTVSRAIKMLKDRKYLDIYKTGSSNVYAISKYLVSNGHYGKTGKSRR